MTPFNTSGIIALMAEKPISVKLQPKTIERLRKLKHPGQSWDGLINELLDKVEKGKNETKILDNRRG